MLIICQIDWREVGVAFELQCLRNCTLSSLIVVSGFEPVCRTNISLPGSAVDSR